MITKLITYQKLFEEMEGADPSGLYSKHLWHFTHYKNLINIIRDGRFYARKFNKNIPYDNRANNETTRSVLESNKSFLTEHYVRLYLRPKNVVYFNMKNNMGIENIVIISLKRNIIQYAFKPVMLHYENAVYATRDDLDWKYKINKHIDGKFNMLNYDLFDFNTIYKCYDTYDNKSTKSKQCAECLVYKDLSIQFIECINFYSPQAMSKFLNELSLVCDSQQYSIIENKCRVSSELFYNS